MVILDIIPIILAFIAAVMAALKIRTARRDTDKMVYIISVVSAILMIIAQTSWWVSYVLLNDLKGTLFSNIIWGITDSLLMIIIILNSYSRK